MLYRRLSISVKFFHFSFSTMQNVCETSAALSVYRVVASRKWKSIRKFRLFKWSISKFTKLAYYYLEWAILPIRRAWNFHKIKASPICEEFLSLSRSTDEPNGAVQMSHGNDLQVIYNYRICFWSVAKISRCNFISRIIFCFGISSKANAINSKVSILRNRIFRGIPLGIA